MKKDLLNGAHGAARTAMTRMHAVSDKVLWCSMYRRETTASEPVHRIVHAETQHHASHEIQ